ncbi:unnamed protein product [Cylindrotheca closterium]|uniref:Uncharacterized protein n=1 Tax=Cylindrotheca closterium TaxID=2856 RepID=A0AAD2FIB2_9STRA|nr:unnamed protein product [Cylindrotheca closterium]
MKLQQYCLAPLLCALSANMSMASPAPFEVKLDEPDNRDYGEFGRSVNKPKKRRVAKHEPTEADHMYRELIEDVQLLDFASMSMSMGMSLDDNVDAQVDTTPAPSASVPTAAPTAPQTSAPTEAAVATSASCDGQPQVLINIPLEVDTATDDTEIETLIAEALMETLADEYNFCGSRRRLEDGSIVVEDFQLGTITVTKDANETCPPLDPSTSCHVANAAIVVSGETDGSAAKLRNSLGFLFENDVKFIEELPLSGVIEVRLKEGGEESEANSASAFGNAAQPTRSAVVAILSTAGISIVAAIILRARRKEANMAAHDKYCDESDSEGGTLPINNASGSH